MGRTYRPKPKLYTESSINAAIEKVRNGKPVYKTAKKYHMSTSMLRKRAKESNGLFTRKKEVNFRNHFNLNNIRKWTEYYNINCLVCSLLNNIYTYILLHQGSSVFRSLQ